MDDYTKNIMIMAFVGISTGFIVPASVFYFNKSPVLAGIVAIMIGAQAWLFRSNLVNQDNIKKLQLLLNQDVSDFPKEKLMDYMLNYSIILKDKELKENLSKYLLWNPKCENSSVDLKKKLETEIKNWQNDNFFTVVFIFVGFGLFCCYSLILFLINFYCCYNVYIFIK